MKVLGYPLKPTQHVHHHNGSHLVICESPAYHRLLHLRQRVLDRGGNPNSDTICQWCKTPQPSKTFKDGRCRLCVKKLAEECAKWNRNLRLYGDGRGP